MPNSSLFLKKAFYAISALLLGISFYNSLMSQTLLDGESSILSDIVFTYVKTGQWTYPFHAHELFFPGTQRLVMHPPFHYYLSSLFVKAFGGGIWQLLFGSAVISISCVLLVSKIVAKQFGWVGASITCLLACSFYGLFYSSLSLRPDITFGVIYFCFLISCWKLLFTNANSQVWSFISGLLCVATLATHWFGFFVQLYIPLIIVVMIVKFKISSVRLIILSAAGWLSGFFIWYLAIGEDLFKSFVLIIIKGNEFKEILDMSMIYALSYLWKWPGALLIGIGLILALFFIIVNIIKRKHDAFFYAYMVGNLIFYYVFLYFFVGNKAPQYGGNVYFIILLITTYGYLCLVDFLTKWKKQYLSQITLAIIVAAVLVTAQPLRRFVFEPILSSQKVSKNLYKDIKQLLIKPISKDKRIGLGGNVYPFVHEQAYVSTMRMFAENYLKDPGELSFEKLIAYYRNMPGKNYRTSGFTKEMRRNSLLRNVDAFISTEHAHSWQDLFYDVDAWIENYRPVRTVISVHWNLIEHLQAQRTGMFFTVFRKRDSSSCERLEPLVNVVNDSLSYIDYPNCPAFDLGMRSTQWANLDAKERVVEFGRYLEKMNYYGFHPSSDDKKLFLVDYFTSVDSYLTTFGIWEINGVRSSRVLLQALDYSFTQLGFPHWMKKNE